MKSLLDFEKIFILGATGNLGRSLTDQFEFSTEIIEIPSVLYRSWWKQGSNLEIKDFFNYEASKSTRTLVIFAHGVVQKEFSELLFNSNFLIPKNVLQSLEDWNMASVTVGSIHEKFDIKNPYLDSKRILVEWFSSNQIHSNYHFRLHTLYGGHRMDNQMLIPQIVDSLRNECDFVLKDGSQIREYHHIEDVSKNIWEQLARREPGIIEISSGQSLLLADLTREVFQSLKKLELLTVLPFNFPSLETQHRYSFTSQNCTYRRDSVSGVVRWIKNFLNHD